MGDQSSILWGLPDSNGSVLSRHNYHPRRCNCISIVNTGTGKSHFVQIIWFVLCSTRGYWSIITEPECCCNPFVGMVTAAHKWKKSMEISGVVSTLMGLGPRWEQGSELHCDFGMIPFLWLCLSFSIYEPVEDIHLLCCIVCLRLLCCLQRWL